MKFGASIALMLLLASSLFASEQEAPAVVPKMPWVGLDVSPLDDAMRAHANVVPKRVGFLVASVAEGGPAQKADVRPYDILWKFDDQLLVNQAQFGVLISLKRPGDEVKLSLVRAGEEVEAWIKLMPLPKNQPLVGTPPVEIPLVPAGLPGLPKQIVYPKDKTAMVSRQDGSVARLRHVDGEPHVQITDEAGDSIYNGPVREGDELLVPEEWKGSVLALMRTLRHADQRGWRPRAPRPRVVVPSRESQKAVNR